MAKRITKKVLSAINELNQGKTKPYDTAATVLRVEGDTAYVHIPGGVEETPVQLTIDAKPGDIVRVRVSNNQAWLTGNGSAPPTDDTVAVKAEVKAEKADVLAQLAKKTADKAGKTATNYLSWSAEYGLIVSEDATENPDEMTGGSTRVTYDGVEMYKGQTRVAKFGQESVIGDEESANAYLDPDTFKITNADGVDFFSVDMDGNPITTNIYKNIIKYVDGASSMELVLSDGAFDRVPSGGVITVYLYETGSPNSTTQWSVTKGTASTEAKTGSGSGISHTLTYDGIHTFTVSGQTGSYTRWNLAVRGTGQIDAPSFMLGTRDSGSGGAFSSTAGLGLTADGDYQFVVGRYNDNDPDNAFEIGNGGNTAQKVTIFSVDRTGNAKGNNIPTMTDCGAITGVPNVPSHSYSDIQVYFSKVFSSAPIVVVGMMSSSTGYGTGSVSVSAHSIATYGFTARIFNNDTSARSPDIHWIAMLM